MIKTLLGLSLIVVAVAAQEKAPAAPRRIALVIGNSEYASLPKLPGVKRGVPLIEGALRDAGFQVSLVGNFRLPEFVNLERDFAESLRPGDICFVYYAGYAVQAENDNFFLPVNFDPRAKGDLENRAYHFKRLQERLESHGVALKIFVLDAPFQLDAAIPEVSEIGLMLPDLAETRQTVFASAVYPGRWEVIPPAGAASPFTEAVAKAIGERGLTLAQVFDKVRQDCSDQLPYVDSSVVQQQPFYFHAPVKTLPPPPAPPEWPRPNVLVSNRTDREEYLWIRPAKFLMGCVPADTRCATGEKPQHEVNITRGFWIGRNEVQVVSYRKFVNAKRLKMPATPGFPGGWQIGDQPIVNVRWEDAAAYCGWAGGRLPTEAEWEMAARGGKAGEVYPMSGEENSRDKANFAGKKGNDNFEFVSPVRKFDPNPFGLFDLAGNVWEWVGDFYSPTYYTAGAVSDPQGPGAGKDHVIRGGSWDSDPKEHLRISFRKGFGGTSPGVGFRCVIPDTPETRKLLPEAAR